MSLTEPVPSKPNRYGALRLPLARLDGRTRAGKVLRGARRDILAALGHEPDPIEAIHADVAAALMLHVHLLTARASATPDAALAARLAQELAAALNVLGLRERTTEETTT